MELHYKEFGQGDPVVILHGLFGFSDNWQTVAKSLAEQFWVITPDLRNHGRSPHLDTHSYPEMAEDLLEFLHNQWIFSSAVVGHSMGGKVAMQLALDYPDQVSKLVVVDMEPGQSASNHDNIFESLFALKIQQIASRKEAEDFLSTHIKDFGTLQFLLKNITRNPDGKYSWKMNLPVLYKEYEKILGPVSGMPFEKPALFIRGGDSDYVRDEEWPATLRLFPNARLVTIPHAGHWVHADQPAELTRIILEFLAK